MSESESEYESEYERRARCQLQIWRARLLREPGLLSRTAAQVQSKLNSYIPDKVHAAVTASIKQMTQGVLDGSALLAPEPVQHATLEARERVVMRKVAAYRTTAATEGGITGAGGFLLGLVDFPLLLGIKLKLLFDIAAAYGHSCADYRERHFLLQVFQLAFSSQAHRRKVFLQMEHDLVQTEAMPTSLQDFDWRAYQEEYRNYIDLAKLAQLLPAVGAPIGIVVNYGLIQQLSETATQAYRLRWFAAKERLQLTHS